MPGSDVELAVAEVAQIRSVVDRAVSGDRDAAMLLIAGIAPVVRTRIARALRRRRAEARGRRLRHDLEDLVQEAFAALFDDGGRALRAWDPARGLGFLAFVGLLADREVAMVMRTRKRNPWTEDPTAHDAFPAPDDADGVAVRLEARDQLRRLAAQVAARLDWRGRRYFQLLVVEDRPVRAVAAATGASPEALYAWRSRLTRLAREVLTELERPRQRSTWR